MAQLLCFSRNRCVAVEQSNDQTMRASCRLQDPIIEALVEIVVKLPDLEISEARGEIRRPFQGEKNEVTESLQPMLGIRIGPGLKKILKGLMGKSAIQKQLTFMVEECCNGVILTFTKDVMLQAPKDQGTEMDYFKNLLKSNPRLYNSCAAFAPGSPLVEGFDPPK